MSNKNKWSSEIAQIIVDSGAIYTRTDGDPYFYSSGWASPVFIDCKRLMSAPVLRTRLVDMAMACLEENLDLTDVDVIAGCELSGIPFATMIADRLVAPLVLVSRRSKGFGRLAQFEGTFEPDDKVLLVDDLATDGISEGAFRKALQNADAEVTATFVMVNLDVFPTDHKIMSLGTLTDIYAYAREIKYFGVRDNDMIEAFIDDAPAWSRRNGGIGSL